MKVEYVLGYLTVALIISLAAPQNVQAVQPKEGIYKIQQKQNDRYVDAHESSSEDYALVTRPRQSNYTQRWILTPIDSNIYTIQQKATGRYVDAHESSSEDYALVTRPAQDNDTQRWILTPIDSDTYTIQQKVNDRYVDAHESSSEDYALVTRPRQSADTQKWILTSIDSDTYTIQQKATGRYVDAHDSSSEDYALVTRPAQDNDTQRWILTPVFLPETVNNATKIEYLAKYAPRVYLHGSETYWPSSVEWSFNFLKRQTMDDGKWRLTTDEPLDEPSSVLNYFHGCDPKNQNSEFPCNLMEVPVYAFWSKVDAITYDLVYFFYYPYNRGKKAVFKIYGNHVGDWEHITVRLFWQSEMEGDWTLRPEQFYYAHHSSGKVVPWSKVPKVADSTHPIVYSALHSHGSWISTGTHSYHEYLPLTDETQKGTKWDTWNKMECFDYDAKKGLGVPWAGKWPNWLQKDEAQPIGNVNPGSGPIYRWGNAPKGWNNILELYELTNGPSGPANKPYFGTKSLD